MARKAETSRTRTSAGARKTTKKNARKSSKTTAKKKSTKTAVKKRAKAATKRKAVKKRSTATSKAGRKAAKRVVDTETNRQLVPLPPPETPPVADTPAPVRRIRPRLIPITNGGTQVGPGTKDQPDD